MVKLLTDVRDRALKRPWLLAPPLLGMLGQNVVYLVAPDSVPARTVLSGVMIAAVTTIFAELWFADGFQLARGRFVSTFLLYLIPYPLLLLFGLLTAPLVYWILRADLPHDAAMLALYGVLALGKLCALSLGAASSLAALRRTESAGTWSALRRGFSTLGANAGFFLPALTGIWLFQEACVYLASQLAPGVFAGFFTTAIPLLGCVALPVEAWRSGRLSKP